MVKGRIKGWMPGSQYPVSRDWEDIDCSATSCRNNDRRGKCIVPSVARIGDDGRCTGFRPVMAAATASE